MSGKLRLVGNTLILAAVVALGWYLYRTAEWTSEEVGYSTAARRNPVLALERLVTELGGQVTSEPVLGRAPERGEVLVLNAGVRALPPPRLEELLAWTATGEHWVVTLVPSEATRGDVGLDESLHANEQRLLEALGLELRHAEPWPLETLDVRPLGAAADDASEAPPLRMRAHAPPYFRAVRQTGAPDAKTRFLAGNGERSGVLVAVPYGAGWVTLQTDGRWWENEDIDSFDHAHLAWLLLRGRWIAGGQARPGEELRVRFVTSYEYPGLLRALATHAWPALAGLCLWIVLGLWRASTRFGPLVGPPPVDRRDFAEHVAAAGQFSWRIDRGEALLGTLRRDVLARAALLPAVDRAGGSTQLSTEPLELNQDDLETIVDALTARTDLTRDALHAALRASATGDARRFTRLVRNLATIRRQL